MMMVNWKALKCLIVKFSSVSLDFVLVWCLVGSPIFNVLLCWVDLNSVESLMI